MSASLSGYGAAIAWMLLGVAPLACAVESGRPPGGPRDEPTPAPSATEPAAPAERETPGGKAPVSSENSPGVSPGRRAPLAAEAPEAHDARQRLVDGLVARLPGLSPRVVAALRAVPRHLFAPGAPLAAAYADHAFPIGYQQTISQPTVVAIMTDALLLTGRERVLEIGTGSGYQAAILSLLAKEVDSIEIVAPLGEAARQRLAALGYANVKVRIGDGYAGWPDAAPFDRVILTAAPPAMPKTLLDQLADGGVLVAPLGEGDDQTLERWTKHGARFARESLGGVRFVPMVAATPDTR